MTQSNKFESLLELLINEETDKAEQLFHEIVVEKSRDIYEGLADENTAEKKDEAKDEVKEEAKEEAKEDDKKEEVKETEASEEKKDEEVKETESTETKKDEVKTDEGVFSQPVQKTDEESIEEIGGDATDALIKDISSDEEGEGEKAADDMGADMDANGDENGENGEEGSVEDRVVDLEDALDELKAEFEAMMGNKDGEEDSEDESLEPVIPAQETQPEVSMGRLEGKDTKESAKETVKEYSIKKTHDNGDKSDKSAKSPVKTGGAKQGGTPVKTGGGAEDKGRPAPTAEKMGKFANSPGHDKGTAMKQQVKADTKDGSDKSGKSPISGK